MRPRCLSKYPPSRFWHRTVRFLSPTCVTSIYQPQPELRTTADAPASDLLSFLAKEILDVEAFPPLMYHSHLS